MRVWNGMGLPTWIRLLKQRGRTIVPGSYWQAVSVSLTTPFNSLFGVLSEALFSRRAARAEILPPLFVLGHWRSGTTLLHELFTLDERFGFPSSYECTAPQHFMLTEWWLAPVMQLLTPKQRPMDAMPLHVSLPQEDEFALCVLGARSPYLSWAFPEQLADWPTMLDTEGFSPEDRRKWKETLLWFAARLSAKKSKRIVFKSPPHTARVKALLECFPTAQFVHISREPYDLCLSTVKMWKNVTKTHWFERTDFQRLEEQVIESFERIYRAYERDRPAIPPGQLFEVRFEELTARPLEVMEAIYQRLNLGQFDAVRPKLEKYFADRKDYKKQEYSRDTDLERRIAERWSGYYDRFGYQRPS